MSRLLALSAALVAVSTGIAEAADQCVSVGVDFTPTDSLQIVAWIEKADGTYVDTIYMTAKTGIYGLGNRPGRFDFNSGPVPDPAKGVDDLWPYGRRITTFPVWAHRHGIKFPSVVFQDGNENGLSHAYKHSTTEQTYCRPAAPTSDLCGRVPGKDEAIWDTGTCASVAFTDKGVFSAETSLYPPRADLTRQSFDSPSVAMFRALNPFDAVSKATPVGGAAQEVAWTLPADLENYVMWIEVSKAFDFNATYNATVFPAPDVGYGTCGLPYRGQPSVLYRVPFTSATQTVSFETSDYAGYGDADGATGTLHPQDATITGDTPGSGALRLQLVSDGGMYRVRVTTTPQEDAAAPGAPRNMEPMAVASTTATLQFVEPGDDDLVGKVSRYEIRARADGAAITEANFDDSAPVLANVKPAGAGQVASVNMTGLLPETEYWVGIRAVDDCFKKSPIAVAKVTTAVREVAEVDWCFVATAAYGSIMANDVEMLRHFRDSMLKNTVMGELFVETYYTFGPAVAGVVGESDLLRATARAVLAPIVSAVRKLSF